MEFDKKIEVFSQLLNKKSIVGVLTKNEEELLTQIRAFREAVMIEYNKLKTQETLTLTEEEKTLINEYENFMEKTHYLEFKKRNVFELYDLVIHWSPSPDIPSVATLLPAAQLYIKTGIKATWESIKSILNGDIENSLNLLHQIEQKNPIRYSIEELEYSKLKRTFLTAGLIVSILSEKKDSGILDFEEEIILSECENITKKNFEMEFRNDTTENLEKISSILAELKLPALGKIRLECILEELERRQLKKDNNDVKKTK